MSITTYFLSRNKKKNMQTPLLSVALCNNNVTHLVPAKAGLNSGVVLFSSGQ